MKKRLCVIVFLRLTSMHNYIDLSHKKNKIQIIISKDAARDKQQTTPTHHTFLQKCPKKPLYCTTTPLQEPLHRLPQTLLQPRPPLSPLDPPHNLLGPLIRHAHQILLLLAIGGELAIGIQFAEDAEDLVPVVGFGETEQTLVVDFGVNQRTNVNERAIDSIDVPFYLVSMG